MQTFPLNNINPYYGNKAFNWGNENKQLYYNYAYLTEVQIIISDPFLMCRYTRDQD